MYLKNRKIVLIVCGSIAAYKAVELVRELTRLGAEVQVVMTEAAKQFVGALTFQALTNLPVRSSMLDSSEEFQIGHIELGDKADLVIVAPATADFISRAACGSAADLPSAVLLATKAKVLLAPAMNVNMWNHPLTQANLQTLRKVGYQIIDPVEGELACGWQGVGRLAELEEILDEVKALLTRQDLTGVEVLVSASTTREALDPIRYIANRSSGRMGYAIADDARRRGALVTLISGPSELRAARGVCVVPVTTALEMQQALVAALERPAAAGISKRLLFMVAAVADHRPSFPSTTKLKHDKSKGAEIQLEPNPDILREIGEGRSRFEQLAGVPLRLVGFAAETGSDEELLASAREKLKRKKVDLIVGNLAEHSFDRESTRVWLVARDGVQEEIALADKALVGSRVVSAAMNL